MRLALFRKILWLLIKNVLGFLAVALFIIFVCYLPTAVHIVPHQTTADAFVWQGNAYWRGVAACLRDFSHFDFSVLHEKVRWSYLESESLDYIGGMIWRSATIAVPALLFGTLLGMLLGASLFFLPASLGRFVQGFNRLVFSLPDILLILLIQTLAVAIDVWTNSYLISVADIGGQQMYVLPWICLGLPVMATVFGYSSQAYQEASSQPYVRTVQAKGLPKGLIFLKHVVRPASDALLAVFPKIVTFALSGLIMVEKLFNVRGISWWIDAKIMTTPKYPEILALLTIDLAILVTSATIVTSMLRLWVNPALRKQEGRLVNRSLLLGIGGTAILLLLILLGPQFAPHTMEDLRAFRQVVVAGHVIYQGDPLSPDAINPLGTDLNGRDMLSKILWGARITLPFVFAVAVGRMLLAMPLGYLGAQLPRFVGVVVEKISLACTSVPMFLIVLIVFWVFYFTDAISSWQMFLLMGGVLAILGLFPTAFAIQSRTRALMHCPFVEGQRAIGAGHWHLLRKHLFPYLASDLAVLFITEIAQTLWLITQLGIFKVFIGGTKIVQGATDMRFPAEWAGSIGDVFYAFHSHPLLVIEPAIAIAFAILSLNLLADGIRQRNARKWGMGA